MNVELASGLFVQRLLQRIDSRAEGAFVEIGMGTVNYSFTWAAPLGFKCYAVEPLPSEALRSACSVHRVELAEIAIADHTGQVKIFHGEINGSKLSDLSSLNPRWWGSGKDSRLVPSSTIADFYKRHHIRKTSFLKVDTEGSELNVLQGLLFLAPECLPELVLFEYGGGATKASGMGGWTPEFFESTLACLSVLKRLGYMGGLLIEQAFPEPKLFDVQQADFSTLFPGEAVVGNAIVRRSAYSCSMMEEIHRFIAPELAEDARCERARARCERFDHYKGRAIEGIKRRLRWLKRS